MKKINAKNKREFEELKKEYRNNGYNFVTFTKRFVELENMDGDMVVIEY